VKTSWLNMSYFFLFPLFHLVLIAETVVNPFPVVTLSFLFAESIHEYLVGHWHQGALGLSERQCPCRAQYLIRHLAPSRHHLRLGYPGHHSSQANFQCQKWFQVHYRRNFRLKEGWFIWFDGRLLLEFFLQAGPLQTHLVAMMIFLTI